MYMFSPKELAPNEDQGVMFGAIDVPGERDPRAADLRHGRRSTGIFQSEPLSSTTASRSPSRRTGSAASWSSRGKSEAGALDLPRSRKSCRAELWSSIAGIRAPVFLPSALPSAGFFPVEFVISSTANHEEVLRFAQQLVQEAAKSGQFAFPPLTDVRRSTEAKSEIVLDRDKIASMGLTMQASGR